MHSKADNKKYSTYMQLSKKRKTTVSPEDVYAQSISSVSVDTLKYILFQMGCSEKTINEVARLQINGEHWKQICLSANHHTILQTDLYVENFALRQRLCTFT